MNQIDERVAETGGRSDKSGAAVWEISEPRALGVLGALPALTRRVPASRREHAATLFCARPFRVSKLPAVAASGVSHAPRPRAAQSVFFPSIAIHLSRHVRGASRSCKVIYLRDDGDNAQGRASLPTRRC